MIYTAQMVSEGGGFSPPWGDDVEICKNKQELVGLLDYWRSEHLSTGNDPDEASLRVFIGRYDDVTDMYPDLIVSRGPRGGCRFTRC